MSVEEAGQWHGWASGENAMFISPMGEGEDHVGLYMQQGRSTELAAVFVDPAMAQLVMDWLDESLTETAEANSQLTRMLQSEQPLLFARPASAAPDLDDEEEDDDGGD